MEAMGTPDLSLPVSMGTTIMAASYDGGVVMGADSRTSTGSCECRRLAAAALPHAAADHRSRVLLGVGAHPLGRRSGCQESVQA